MIDLHTHSTHSDGTLTPTQLVRLAAELGVTALALCDHNTVSGLPELMAAAREYGVEGVPGVEFSTEYRGVELHILGLFIRPERYDEVKALLRQMLQRKEQSNRELVERLKTAGIELDYDRIKAGTPEGMVNRAVIGAEMVRLGYCKSIQDAFRGWLDQKRGYYQPPLRLDAFEAIRFIHSIGAVSVLAHPFLNLSQEELPVFLQQAKRCGLDAMETYYPKFTTEQMQVLCRMAEEYGLLRSGGSDFHGDNKPDIRLGTGRDNLQVPADLLEAMKERLARRKNI